MKYQFKLIKLRGATRNSDLFRLKVLDFSLWFGILCLYSGCFGYALVRLITG